MAREQGVARAHKQSLFRRVLMACSAIAQAMPPVIRLLTIASLSSAFARWITAILRTLRVILLLVIISAIVTTLVSAYNIKPSSIAWDWLELLIVPAVIALASLWFNRQQRERELRIADQRTRAEALEAYLDNMSELLRETEAPLHSAEPGDSVTIVARARTLSVLPRLDGNQKRTVLVFLYETGLLNAREGPVISLNHADLTNAKLHYARGFLVTSDVTLEEIDLSGSYLSGSSILGLDLTGAYLKDADLRRVLITNYSLRRAFLNGANLSKASFFLYNDLSDANLSGVDLSNALLAGVGVSLAGADLSNTYLERAKLVIVNLSNADLSNTCLKKAVLIRIDLSNANLCGADLSSTFFADANLSEADLSGAVGITNEKLVQQAASLEGATMPDGQKYEDWLKHKEGRGENGENSGPS